MSDDGFFREVNQELRQDQAKALWDRYGPIAIALAVVIILGTAAFAGWEYLRETRANASGDAFSKALVLANEGKADDALAALKELEDGGYGAYPVLARLRAATVLADKADFTGAIAGFDSVSTDTAIPEAIRDMARLRAGLLMVDHGTYQDVSSRVEALTSDTHPLRFTAREALALSAWKGGRPADALTLLDQIAGDEAAPRNTRDRADLLADLIRGSGDAS